MTSIRQFLICLCNLILVVEICTHMLTYWKSMWSMILWFIYLNCLSHSMIYVDFKKFWNFWQILYIAMSRHKNTVSHLILVMIGQAGLWHSRLLPTPQLAFSLVPLLSSLLELVTLLCPLNGLSTFGLSWECLSVLEWFGLFDAHLDPIQDPGSHHLAS